MLALSAANRHGIVAGGMDASYSVFDKLLSTGLIGYKGPGAASITDKGVQALKDGFYFTESDEMSLERTNIEELIDNFIGGDNADLLINEAVGEDVTRGLLGTAQAQITKAVKKTDQAIKLMDDVDIHVKQASLSSKTPTSLIKNAIETLEKLNTVLRKIAEELTT